MLNLGAFEKDDKTGKLTGTFYGVNMYPTKLIFEPGASEKGKLYYTIYAQSQHATVQAGAAWPKVSQGENAKPYIDVKLASPGLASTFYGKLFENEVVPNQYHLLWDEPKHTPKAEAKATHAEAPARRQATTAPAP
jgi:uncharacterized protein (DUF736 family)